MSRVRFTRGSDDTVLTQVERHRFEGLERALRTTDPDWLARHYPRRQRQVRVARRCVAVIAVALLIVGTLTSMMLVVFAGVLLAFASVTSLVSSQARPRRDQPRMMSPAPCRCASTGSTPPGTTRHRCCSRPASR
jgi:hypothetical protein